MVRTTTIRDKSYFFLSDFPLSFIYVHVRVCAGAYKGQARALKTLKQETQAVGNHLTWTLETEFRSFRRAANALSTEPTLQPEQPYR